MDAIIKSQAEKAVALVKPMQLVIRCFVERKGDQWQAFSLEFGLAAQGDSELEVKRKLDDMVLSYVQDALISEDRAHAPELLARKATWRIFARYYFYWAILHIAKDFIKGSRDCAVYCSPLALEPKPYPA